MALKKRTKNTFLNAKNKFKCDRIASQPFLQLWIVYRPDGDSKNPPPGSQTYLCAYGIRSNEISAQTVEVLTWTGRACSASAPSPWSSWRRPGSSSACGSSRSRTWWEDSRSRCARFHSCPRTRGSPHLHSLQNKHNAYFIQLHNHKIRHFSCPRRAECWAENFPLVI